MRYRRVWIGISSAIFAGLLAASGCQNQQPPQRPAAPEPPRYVGNSACAECHPREFKDHTASNHNHTLRQVGSAGLGELSPPMGAIPHTKYAIQSGPDGLTFAKPGASESA